MRRLTKFLTLSCMTVLLGIATASNAKADELTLSLNDKWVDGHVDKEEADFYTIDVQEPGKLTIVYQVTSDHMEAKLYDADMITEYRGASAGGSAQSPGTSSIDINLEKGQYILKSYNYWGDSGDYRIKARFDAAGNKEKEPNNVYQEAMAVKEGTTMKGFLSQTDLVDYYSFSLKSSKTVRFVVNSNANWYKFTVYDKDMYEKFHNSYNGTGLKTFEVKLGAGTYYYKIEADGTSTDTTGTYTVKWNGFQYVTGVTLKSKKVVLEKGKKYSLIKTVKPADATNKKLTWTTSDRSIVAVDTSGKITAKAPGVATVTGTTKDGSDITVESKIIVKPQQAKIQKCSVISGRHIVVQMRKEKGISGIQYELCRKPNFKGKISSYFAGSDEFKATTATLTGNKDYYVRVRYYTSDWGTRYYGQWSKVYKLKTKKTGYKSGYFAWKDCK